MQGAARTLPDGAYAAALALCAALAIASAPWALAMPWLAFAFKRLATFVIIAFARQRRAGRADVRRWVLAGLGFSLAGDIALLWPKDGFLPGLVSFLFAHLAYLQARRLATGSGTHPHISSGCGDPKLHHSRFRGAGNARR